jgi:transposase
MTNSGELIQPLLPRPARRRYRHPGRKRIDDRKVLKREPVRGLDRHRLAAAPQQFGFGSGMTCWRRLRDWQQAGVWQRLHELLLAKLRHEGRLDLSRAVCDSASLRAPLGAPPGSISTDAYEPATNAAPTSTKPSSASPAASSASDTSGTH